LNALKAIQIWSFLLLWVHNYDYFLYVRYDQGSVPNEKTND